LTRVGYAGRGRRGRDGDLLRWDASRAGRAPTDACREAIHLAAQQEGVVLDPVYSGKAMAGLMAELRAAPTDGRLASAQAIVSLATGGLPALFASRYGEWLAG
jgi:1-aminocyclopropane-1-carboxylate deaminase/D-cysteine desulfhydrase-like pyridoxal-dependent ACC family enzyme